MASLSQISISNNQFSSPLVVRSSNNSIVSQTISLRLPTIFGSELKSGEIEQTHLRLLSTFKKSPRFTVKASTKSAAMTQELENSKIQRVAERESGFDYFEMMKLRFLSFKKHKYMENLEHYQSLAKGQAPKFMVIACADSRVCPSAILGFQPGEAFTVRNVANLVPPFESGPSETKAALEFAVNSLKVENILVIGHSCCGGIRALMSMEDEGDSRFWLNLLSLFKLLPLIIFCSFFPINNLYGCVSYIAKLLNSSFIKNWVVVGENARLSTKTIASNLNFDQQCQHCEKESVNHSLLNLLTYPWIEEKVKRGVLYIHGSYYDFVNCTFEKWTLDHQENRSKETKRFSIKDRLVWG